MRFLGVFLVGLLLAAPAMAQNTSSGAHTFGGANCTQKLPCPNSYASNLGETYAASTSSCVTQFFGFSSPNGFFETGGLDGSGCLVNKADALPRTDGKQTVPHCCIVQQNNSCNFHCDLILSP